MSGLAELLLHLGFRVSGSDARLSQVTERLANLGASVFEGHAATHLAPSVSTLVYSSAILQDNPEIQEASRRAIPIIARAEVLAELMRLKFGVGVAGSHGKTSTTSMTAHILQFAGLDPTVVIGGQLCSAATGARLGTSDFLVAETDESDKSFLMLRPTIAVVTNVDEEHMGAYGSFAALKAAFQQFMQSVPFYGLTAACIDDPVVRELLPHVSRRTVTYGLSAEAEIRAVDLEHREGRSSARILLGDTELGRLDLRLPGRHMVVNALAGIAVARELGVAPAVSIEGLQTFEGVRRRLEMVGSPNGIRVMNDYGHHPAEIRATLRAVRDGWGNEIKKLRVLFQPHRYTRTRDSFQDFLTAFELADELIITEIYAASEHPIEGVSGERLQQAVRHPASSFVSSIEEGVEKLVAEATPGDFILCLGAGSVGGAPEAICRKLDIVAGTKDIAHAASHDASR